MSTERIERVKLTSTRSLRSNIIVKEMNAAIVSVLIHLLRMDYVTRFLYVPKVNEDIVNNL